MKLIRIVIAAFVALAVSLVGISAAQAYPTPVFKLSLNRHVVYGGDSFAVTVTSSVECTTWKVDFLGQSRSGHNVKTFAATFVTPKVKKKETRQVTAICTYSAAVGAAGTAIRITAASSGRLRAAVTILPRTGTGTGTATGTGNNSGSTPTTSNDSGSGLPNTGGPAFWIILLALVLVIGGGVAMVRNRRRHEATTAAPSGTPTQ